MPSENAYAQDLAYIHDSGFGDFARSAAPELLALLAAQGIRAGRVVDLGCGSGIWARALVDAGYAVTGVDISPAMLALARQRVPAAEFHVASLFEFPVPECAAVMVLGEVLNYAFDASNSPAALERFFRGVQRALQPGGLLVFDLAEPGRSRGRSQSFREGPDWTCLVEYQHDAACERLTRRIVTFRQVGNLWRRHEEVHVQQLYDRECILRLLAAAGFLAQASESYGACALAESTTAFIAHKPPTA